jgi:hypothetical protein
MQLVPGNMTEEIFLKKKKKSGIKERIQRPKDKKVSPEQYIDLAAAGLIHLKFT